MIGGSATRVPSKPCRGCEGASRTRESHGSRGRTLLSHVPRSLNRQWCAKTSFRLYRGNRENGPAARHSTPSRGAKGRVAQRLQLQRMYLLHHPCPPYFGSSMVLFAFPLYQAQKKGANRESTGSNRCFGSLRFSSTVHGSVVVRFVGSAGGVAINSTDTAIDSVS